MKRGLQHLNFLKGRSIKSNSAKKEGGYFIKYDQLSQEKVKKIQK